MKAAFDWALQMKSLLRRPREILLATVKAWQAFNSEDGDISYFNDLDADVATQSIKTHRRTMQNIKAKFRQLDEYQEKIVALSKSCSDYQKAVSRVELPLGLPRSRILLTIE
jgi:hypothetical protein